MDDLLLKLYYEITNSLYLESPYLSGNLMDHILKGQLNPSMGDKEITFVINAPFYDSKIWNKEHKIVFTGPPKKYPDVSDYAMWLNDLGAFGKPNKSRNWANRAIVHGCRNFTYHEPGNRYIIINNLPLRS